MSSSKPQFTPGDRCFSHYAMQWGTITRKLDTQRGRTSGVTGDPMPDTTWYDVRLDNGRTEMLDDAHGNWDMARVVPPHIARRYGYGEDPSPTQTALSV